MPRRYRRRPRRSMRSRKFMKLSNSTRYQPSFKTELKSVDTLILLNNVNVNQQSVNESQISGSNMLTELNLIQQGSGPNNRIGRKVRNVSMYIQLSCRLKPDVNKALPPMDARMFIVYDLQPNGAKPDITDIFQSVSQTSSAATYLNSGVNLNNKARFVILYDNLLTLPGTWESSASGVVDILAYANPKDLQIQKYIPLQGATTIYKTSSSPAVIGDITSGSLLLGFITRSKSPLNPTGQGNNTPPTPPTVTLDSCWDLFGTCRLRFQD